MDELTLKGITQFYAFVQVSELIRTYSTSDHLPKNLLKNHKFSNFI